MISMAKALGEQFVPLLEKLAPSLAPYLDEKHPRSDNVMAIGCLSEIFNSSPTVISTQFETFYQILMRMSVTDDGSLNRNVAYGIGVLAKKAPKNLFEPHTSTAV
jgi:hypothetical protein